MSKRTKTAIAWAVFIVVEITLCVLFCKPNRPAAEWDDYRSMRGE